MTKEERNHILKQDIDTQKSKYQKDITDRNGETQTMKLKSFMLVVKDNERARQFYHDLFGLEMLVDNDGNMLLSDGLVLQEERYWRSFIGRDIVPRNNACELYFEEQDVDGFYERLLALYPETEFVNLPMTHAWGQRVVRFYDPDRHIIEVGENLKTVCRRFLLSGMTPEETAVRMDVPLKYVMACMR